MDIIADFECVKKVADKCAAALSPNMQILAIIIEPNLLLEMLDKLKVVWAKEETKMGWFRKKYRFSECTRAKNGWHKHGNYSRGKVLPETFSSL